MMAQDVIFADRELEIENIEKFAFNTANIALAEDTGAQSPVHVLERRVIKIL